jgi:transposase
MRGKDEQQLDVFSYISPEQRVPQDHPLRSLRAMTDEALQQLQPRFNRLYAKTGRPSIAPEKLLRALLLQALYSVRSERMLMEQLDYNLLFRWFVGLNMDDPIWDVTVFTKNRERLLDGDMLSPSSKLCSSKDASGICSRTSTSQWMERCWKPGRV